MEHFVAIVLCDETYVYFSFKSSEWNGKVAAVYHFYVVAVVAMNSPRVSDH